ncbi:hypothetical protein [Nocardioides sp.]|uniref:hypothetical protein n=1 Tax=Nocardioides sp. TaxID=35761 RepID=UPI00286C3786|nr:hypothetical protein [Nocardioides sp.]
MSTVAKFLVGLALVLPMTGYVVGSLVSSSAREPDRRDPVIVKDVREQSPVDDGPAPSPRPSPGLGQGSGANSKGDGDQDDDPDVDQNGITVVKPETDRPDDDGDDDRDGDDDGDDDRDDRTDTDDD